MKLIHYNGKIYSADSPVFLPNRAMVFGDGIFETMRINEGELLFFHDHMERMFSGMKALQLYAPIHFTSEYLHPQMIGLWREEGIGNNGRIRVGIFRGGSGTYEPLRNEAEYFIEAFPMQEGFRWNAGRGITAVFPWIKKDFSSLSFCKTMNALPYVMAAIYKTQNGLDECFLTNTNGFICDAVSSNVFWIKNREIFSPPATDGGIEGVMRKNVIRILLQNDISFTEKSVTPEQMKMADEVFVTNVVHGIKPVGQWGEKHFSHQITSEVFRILTTSLSGK